MNECIRCKKRPVFKTPKGTWSVICKVCFLKAIDVLFLEVELHDREEDRGELSLWKREGA